MSMFYAAFCGRTSIGLLREARKLPLSALTAYMPEQLRTEILKEAETLIEIRIRAGKRVQLVGSNQNRFVGEALDADQVRKIALAMMDHSYYSREDELCQGFFTMSNGFRVGVCGRYIERTDGRCLLGSIASLCIRVAREIPGCAQKIVKTMIREGRPESGIILSRPGMGKTTFLRDSARILSGMGWMVGIADERHEIAACRNGIPTLDVGDRCDIVDGLNKALAIERLIRTMAPQVIITDEIGDERDVLFLQEAARKGIVVIASAHASSINAFEKTRAGKLLADRIFTWAAFLDGQPGNIAEIRCYD